MGGLILSTLCRGPSRLTRISLSRMRVMITLAVSPSSRRDCLEWTMSMPWKRPTPRISPTKSQWGRISSFSLLFRQSPVSLAFSCNFCHQMTSSTALTAVMAIGLPPKVLKNYMSRLPYDSAIYFVQTTAATGKPLPMALPIVRMFGTTLQCSKAQKESPRRPKPVCTSSPMQTMFFSLNTLYISWQKFLGGMTCPPQLSMYSEMKAPSSSPIIVLKCSLQAATGSAQSLKGPLQRQGEGATLVSADFLQCSDHLQGLTSVHFLVIP